MPDIASFFSFFANVSRNAAVEREDQTTKNRMYIFHSDMSQITNCIRGAESNVSGIMCRNSFILHTQCLLSINIELCLISSFSASNFLARLKYILAFAAFSFFTAITPLERVDQIILNSCCRQAKSLQVIQRRSVSAVQADANSQTASCKV